MFPNRRARYQVTVVPFPPHLRVSDNAELESFLLTLTYLGGQRSPKGGFITF